MFVQKFDTVILNIAQAVNATIATTNRAAISFCEKVAMDNLMF